MQKFIIPVLLLVWLNLTHAQSLPKLGNDTLLDVACWNIEWFGNTDNGPTDEVTQYNNVRRILNETDIDVWGLCEVSNTSTFNTLLNDLGSKYNGVNSAFSATQKMALIYKTSMFNLIPSLTFNLSLTSSQNYQFASRPPLQVALQTKGGNNTDTLYFLVVHLKAFADQESYNQRVASSQFLKNYVETNLAGKKFMIIGDWNDMLRFSTYNQAVSPFKNFLDASYLFISKRLEEAGKRSYAFSASFIDHIMLSKQLDSFYISNSSNVWDNAGSFISNFSQNTSDHYPVYGFFNWNKLITQVFSDTTTTAIKSNNLSEAFTADIYPNPTSGNITINCNFKNWHAIIVNTQGIEVANLSDLKPTVNLSALPSGVYFAFIKFDHNIIFKKIFKHD